VIQRSFLRRSFETWVMSGWTRRVTLVRVNMMILVCFYYA
jgi:hypothetical protein